MPAPQMVDHVAEAERRARFDRTAGEVATRHSIAKSRAAPRTGDVGAPQAKKSRKGTTTAGDVSATAVPYELVLETSDNDAQPCIVDQSLPLRETLLCIKLPPGEPVPVQPVQSKRHLPKVMVLAALALPRFAACAQKWVARAVHVAPLESAASC